MKSSDLETMKFARFSEWLERHPIWKITERGTFPKGDNLVRATVNIDGKTYGLGFIRTRHQKNAKHHKKMMRALNKAMAQLCALSPSEREVEADKLRAVSE